MFTTTHVGANNANWVMNYLHDCGITVVDESLGGNGYRKVAWTVGREMPVVDTVQSGMAPATVPRATAR
jgi:chemotaxis receptor (MCP) glutamine deamidase CheD